LTVDRSGDQWPRYRAGVTQEIFPSAVHPRSHSNLLLYCIYHTQGHNLIIPAEIHPRPVAPEMNEKLTASRVHACTKNAMLAPARCFCQPAPLSSASWAVNTYFVLVHSTRASSVSQVTYIQFGTALPIHLLWPFKLETLPAHYLNTLHHWISGFKEYQTEPPESADCY